MQIDPHAWMLTVPLTIALAQACVLPADHFLRRMWHETCELESRAWHQLGFSSPRIRGAGIFRRQIVHAAIAVLALTSVASFATFVGCLPG